jgi:hypothetical protein
MGAVRCYLDGVKTAGGDSICLQLHTAPHFLDRDLLTAESCGEAREGEEDDSVPALDGKREEGPEKEEHVEPPVLTRRFLGDSRTLLFEYQPESGAVVCGGLHL